MLAEVVAQHDSVVVLRVVRTEHERDSPGGDSLDEIGELGGRRAGVGIEFGSVAGTELGPASGVVAEPLA